MRKKLLPVLRILGYLMILLALLMGSVYAVASDYELYYRMQMNAGILDFAGISSEDLFELDWRLSNYLFAPMNADMAFDNREIEVYGEMQPPFNERELMHLRDCRKLLSPTAKMGNYCFLVGAGALLLLCGRERNARRRAAGAAWLASGVILVPLAAFALWAAVDFNSAFNFFHRLLFTNDLWLLNPATDLLIRICPASMFAGIGLRIGLMSAALLLGLPALLTIIAYFDRRKRKQNEYS